MGRPGPHEIDQEQAFLAGVAVCAAAYVDRLKQAGFPEGAAFILARDWHMHFLTVTRDAAADSSEGAS